MNCYHRDLKLIGFWIVKGTQNKVNGPVYNCSNCDLYMDATLQAEKLTDYVYLCTYVHCELRLFPPLI